MTQIFDTVSAVYAPLHQVMTVLGLGQYTLYAMVLLVFVVIGLLRAVYVTVLYRPLTAEEEEIMLHRPDCYHILQRGRVRRW